jgi:hypothetical protein
MLDAKVSAIGDMSKENGPAYLLLKDRDGIESLRYVRFGDGFEHRLISSFGEMGYPDPDSALDDIVLCVAGDMDAARKAAVCLCVNECMPDATAMLITGTGSLQWSFVSSVRAGLHILWCNGDFSHSGLDGTVSGDRMGGSWLDETASRWSSDKDDRGKMRFSFSGKLGRSSIERMRMRLATDMLESLDSGSFLMQKEGDAAVRGPRADDASEQLCILLPDEASYGDGDLARMRFEMLGDWLSWLSCGTMELPGVEPQCGRNRHRKVPPIYARINAPASLRPGAVYSALASCRYADDASAAAVSGMLREWIALYDRISGYMRIWDHALLGYSVPEGYKPFAAHDGKSARLPYIVHTPYMTETDFAELAAYMGGFEKVAVKTGADRMIEAYNAGIPIEDILVGSKYL